MIRSQSIPRSLAMGFFVLFAACWFIASSLAAQDPPASAQPENEISAATDSISNGEPPAGSDPGQSELAKEVEQRLLKWYDTLSKMRAVQIRFHNGTEEDEAAYRREFRELEAQSRLDHEAAFQAATALANQQPEGITDIWDFLIRSVNIRGQFDWYESVAPAAQAIQDLKKNDSSIEIDFPMLDAYQGRALVTAKEWERARNALERAIRSESPSETDYRLLSLLDSLPEQWEREQELRRSEVEADNLPRVLLETTRGDVVIELFEDQAPNTVANFVELVEQGFYDQLPFYTVIDNLFAVTGDPIGDGAGDAGYRIRDETDHADARSVFRGSLFMAKIPDPEGEPGSTIPDTASSQFMISYLPLPVELGQYTVFGRVIEGMPHISLLTRVDPNEKKEEGTLVLPPDRVLSATVLRKREHAYEVERIEYRDQLR